MRISIRELAGAILPRTAEPKVLVLLRAYLDESFKGPRTVIAGFIGTEDQWATVGDQWQAALDKRDAPYFHGSEIQGQRGAFEHWDRWRCDALVNACADVLAASDLGEVSAGFIGDWNNVLREAPGLQERFPTAYAFVFECVVSQMQRAMRGWYAGDKIACVFERQDQHSRNALDVWNARRAAGLWPDVASVAYSDGSLIELQCADMIAHETVRAPEVGAQNLPLLSKLHKVGRFFGMQKQWEETLINAYQRDPSLESVIQNKPREALPPPTPEEHDALVAKYAHLTS